MAVKITPYTADLGTVLLLGSKSVRWQLNLYTDETRAEYPYGKPIGDAGSTMDRAMRTAHKRALTRDGVVILVAYGWSEAKKEYMRIGTVAEFVRQ